jgi:ABC-type polysaccharide/polyol phosphate export permease
MTRKMPAEGAMRRALADRDPRSDGLFVYGVIFKSRFPGYSRRDYVLYVFAGLIPWMFISQGIGTGGLSLVNQQNLLSKIYMPRLFIPASTMTNFFVPPIFR